MKKINLFIISILFISTISHAGIKTLNKKEILFLQNHRIFNVLVDSNNRPLIYKDKDGLYKGLTIELLKLIEKKLNIKFRFIEFETRKLKNPNVIDLFPCAIESKHTDETFNFTEPYVSFKMLVITKNININYLKDLGDKKVSTYSEIINRDIIEELSMQNNFNLLNKGSIQSALNLLKEKKVAAFMTQKEKAYATLGINKIKKYHTFSPNFNFEYSFAVRKKNVELFTIVQKALDSITNKEKKQLISQWYPETKKDNSFAIRTISYILFFSFGCFILWETYLKPKHRKTDIELLKENTLAFNIEKNKNPTFILDIKYNNIVCNKKLCDLLSYKNKIQMTNFENFYSNSFDTKNKIILFDILESILDNKATIKKSFITIKKNNGGKINANLTLKTLKVDDYNHPLFILGELIV